MSNEPYISEKFREEVESHLIGNLLIRDTECPLILGIFGPPGEGKTFQVDEICRVLKIKQIVISPAELESPAQSSDSGNDPVAFLRKKYTEAGSPKGEMGAGYDMYMNKFHPYVLVINDVDTVLGDWGQNVQYSVQRQLLYGELMAICDFPTMVARHTVKRVPIIMTGNDASILYRPLMRPGRMRLLQWVPDASDKLQIIARIFPNIPKKELEKLIDEYPTKPVAFWKDINSRYQEKLLLEWIREKTRDDMRKDLEFRKEYAMEEILSNAPLTLEKIKEFAEEFNKLDISKEVYV
ncbi:MAG: AAA family ATPase [Defluviitaleaceae bacterium]|nr:AAA family ATPase [Defluviitaleaceae bacterium]